MPLWSTLHSKSGFNSQLPNHIFHVCLKVVYSLWSLHGHRLPQSLAMTTLTKASMSETRLLERAYFMPRLVKCFAPRLTIFALPLAPAFYRCMPSDAFGDGSKEISEANSVARYLSRTLTWIWKCRNAMAGTEQDSQSIDQLTGPRIEHASIS